MGLFQHKQDPPKKTEEELQAENEEQFFDEYFREELRNRGRWYFEKIIKESGAVFSQDLDATVDQINVDLKAHISKELDAALAQVNADIKQHLTSQLNEQFADYRDAMKSAQANALDLLTNSTKQLEEEHQRLSQSLQQNVADQKAILHDSFEDNKTQIVAMKDAQHSALEFLNQSIHDMRDDHQALKASVREKVATEQDILIETFKDNMAQIVEYYLLEAVGEEFDLKDQIPAIIKQMEANKQAIVDDMTL